MFHRRISDRVKLLAPFLTFDSDPYPVVSDGRVFWIQDAYTTHDELSLLDAVDLSGRTGATTSATP